MVNRVLMLAFHYPPFSGSSGVQRSLKFSRYLHEFGWQNSVISVQEGVHSQTHPGQLAEIHPDTQVLRTFALDASRHLRLFGSYPALLALPDQYVSWLLSAVPLGCYFVWRFKPAVLWSTYPIATTHLAAWCIARTTGIPWIADFRDSMTEPGYPHERKQRAVYQWVEKRVVRDATRCVFTTPGAMKMYEERYPRVDGRRFRVIENAFDEESFAAVVPREGRENQGRLKLLHSGVLYPSERDPRPFFAALADLKADGVIGPDRVRIVLRASGHLDSHRASIAAAGVEDLVELAPPIAYSDALREMLEADALLLFQASNCNHQIPAKLYEYLRAGRPILALTDTGGDTAAVLRREGVGSIADLADSQSIKATLASFLDRLAHDEEPRGSASSAFANSRFARTRQLASLLDEVVGG